MVTTTYIEDMSNYVLNTDFTSTQFNRWLALATDQVTQEDPGFTAAQQEEAIALLICHRIEMKKNKLDKASENFGGDYSYSRASSLAAKGETQWMRDYTDLKARVADAVKKSTNVQPSAGVMRSDSTVPDAFRLDFNPIPGPKYPDTTITRRP
jgi:hypothetical protein